MRLIDKIDLICCFHHQSSNKPINECKIVKIRSVYRNFYAYPMVWRCIDAIEWTTKPNHLHIWSMACTEDFFAAVDAAGCLIFNDFPNLIFEIERFWKNPIGNKHLPKSAIIPHLYFIYICIRYSIKFRK